MIRNSGGSFQGKSRAMSATPMPCFCAMQVVLSLMAGDRAFPRSSGQGLAHGIRRSIAVVQRPLSHARQDALQGSQDLPRGQLP